MCWRNEFMKEITADQLATKVEAGETLHIIDVREDIEVAQGMIPGAKHIPLGELADAMSDLDTSKHYYMVCRSGGRSGQACKLLQENGYDVTNMAGGMLEWEGELEF